MKLKWNAEWEEQHAEIMDTKKKLSKIMQDQEDIELKRQELDEKLQTVEYTVGLIG